MAGCWLEDGICNPPRNAKKYSNLLIQGDQRVSVHLTKNPHTIDEMKTATTEYIRNVDRAILNMVFENTVRRVSKCLETGGGHLEHYLL
jgi:hypothetical protein